MKEFTLGIILSNNSIYNKVFSSINIKDKKCLFYVEDTIYDKGSFFFESLKNDVNAVMYINQDDYITEINKLASNNILSLKFKELKIPFEGIIIPFNMTKEILLKLESEINDFYQFNQKLYDTI